MQVAVFEDGAAENFLPLTYTKAVFDLRVGRFTLLERVERLFGRVEYAYVRPHLEEFYALDRGLEAAEDSDLELLLVNPRYVLDDGAMEELRSLGGSSGWFVLVHGGDLVGAKLPGALAHEASRLGFNSEHVLKGFGGRVPVLRLEKARALSHPWELIEANAEVLPSDLKVSEGVEGDVDETAKVVGKGGLRVEEGAVVEPYAVFDTRGGGILVEKGAVVKPFAYIEGPAYIGRGTVIMPGARIRSGCSIGPVCRVGGEVEESIIHGYSNKYHDGFLGHAYVGEWVNLGALTTNSDLKNDYSEVVVYINGKPVKTGSTKVGSIIGDHVKTSIGTLLNTGAVIGVMCNVLSTDLSPKYIPSFTWYVNGKLSKGAGFRRMLKTAETMMGRRGKKLTEPQVKLFEYLYEMTRQEREYYIELFHKKAALFAE